MARGGGGLRRWVVLFYISAVGFLFMPMGAFGLLWGSTCMPLSSWLALALSFVGLGRWTSPSDAKIAVLFFLGGSKWWKGGRAPVPFHDTRSLTRWTSLGAVARMDSLESFILGVVWDFAF